MNEEIICNRIFELMLPYSKKETCPVSYIHVTAGHECAIDPAVLSSVFTKKKWDSELQAADLVVVRAGKKNVPDTNLYLASYDRFEVDGRPRDDVTLPGAPLLIGSYC